jgi:uncharacterized DUF497 family protein
MKFTFDPAKDAANILKHGISLANAPRVQAGKEVVCKLARNTLTAR